MTNYVARTWFDRSGRRAVINPADGSVLGEIGDRDAPNVIFTPHLAGITVESQQRILRILADDIAAVLDGGEAPHAVGNARRGVAR